MTLGTGAVAVGASSLFLLLATFAAEATSDFWWNVDAPAPELPEPEGGHSWVRPGSPMDCLLTSRRSSLSVDFGYRSFQSFLWLDSAVDIAVGRTTTILGDGLEKLEPYTRMKPIRVEGLPREVGLHHYLDFIGASLRPESEIRCSWHAWYVATFTFRCDGVPPRSFHFRAECPKLWNRLLHQTVYTRAHGIIDVARGVVATRLVGQTNR